jgi:hypothetical protein
MADNSRVRVGAEHTALYVLRENRGRRAAIGHRMPERLERWIATSIYDLARGAGVGARRHCAGGSGIAVPVRRRPQRRARRRRAQMPRPLGRVVGARESGIAV